MPSLTYAVTGANGFIASHLVKSLVAQGHSVVGTVRDLETGGVHVKSLGASPALVPDVNDQAALERAFAGCDGVFHMAAVHPEYGFAETPEGRDSILATAVDGTTTALKAAKAAGVSRVVLTSSLAAVECGNDAGTLTESTWSKSEVYDSPAKLAETQWATHYTYVKSKVEQERAATAFAEEAGLDLRIVVPGNLCVGPIASTGLNGTMQRLKDVVTGTNTLKGAADLAIVHVADVVLAHEKCMSVESASGRYLAAGDMVKIEDVFAALKELYPSMPVAALENMDIASGIPGQSRKIETGRLAAELGINLTPFKTALKDSVDSMIEKQMIAIPAGA